MGVAVFLILSGYGLNEPAKKGFQAKRFWIKRIITVIVPYFLTRVIMAPFMSTITFKAFLLDVFCLKPQYILGCYLSYIMFWYIIFFMIQMLPGKYRKYDIIIYLLVSVVVFVFAKSALQAQQAFSFVTGIIYSKTKDKSSEIIKKYSFIWCILLTGVGLLFFICKQFYPIADGSYLDWSVKLGYRFAWGCDTVIVVHLLIKKFKFVLFEAIGNISYEIFLVHGYFIETGMMRAYNMIIPCIVITILSAIVLCIFDKKIQNSKLVINIPL